MVGKSDFKPVLGRVLESREGDPVPVTNLSTIIKAVTNLMTLAKDAQRVREERKKEMAPPVREDRRHSIHEPLIQSFDSEDNIKLAEHVSIADLKKLMKEFRKGERLLDLVEFKEAIKDLLSGSPWAYVLSSGEWEQQLESLFAKVDASCDGFVDLDEFCTYMVLQYQEKHDKHISNAPFKREAKIVRNQLSKETITRVCYAANPSRYLSITRDGLLTMRSMTLEWHKSVQVCDEESPGQSAQKFQSSTSSAPRKQRLWVTDMCVMENINKLVISTISRDMHFYDMSTKTYAVQYVLYELEFVPLCLNYWYNKDDPGGKSLLVFGDDNGSIHILQFLHPLKGIFEAPSKKQDGHLRICFKDLYEHVSKVQHVDFMGGSVHSDWVKKVLYIEETDYILSCSASSEQSMVLQDRLKKKNSYIFKVRKGINCFDYNRNLNVIATGSTDHTVRLWNPYVDSKATALLKGHQTSILDVVIHEDMGQIFSYSMDVVLKVHDLQVHTCLQTVMLKFPRGSRPPDHGAFVLHLQLKGANSLLVCSNDSIAELKLANGTNRTTKRAVLSHDRAISCGVYNPLTHQVITGCEGSVVTIWDINTGKVMLKLSNAHNNQEITAMTIDTGGKRLLTGSRNGNVKVWNFNNGHCLKILEAECAAEVTGIVALTEKNAVFTVGWSKSITVYRENSDRFYVTPQSPWRGGDIHKDDILTVAYCLPNLFATASFDGEIIVWSMETQKVFKRFRSGCKNIKHRTKRPSSRNYHDRTISMSGSSPVDKVIFLEARVRERKNDDSVLVSSEGGYAYFWNLYGLAQCGGSFQTACREGESVLAMTTDSENKRLMCGDTAGYIAVYNIQDYCTDGQKIKPKRLVAWHSHSSAVTALEFIHHEQGMFLLSCSTDMTARLWSVHGHFVGTFGQPQPWDLGDRSTFKYPNDPFEAEGLPLPSYLPSIDSTSPGKRANDVQSACGHCPSEPNSPETSPRKMTPDVLNFLTQPEPAQPIETVPSPLELPTIVDRDMPWNSAELESWLRTTTGSTVLGDSWDKVYRKRMVTRQERRQTVGMTDSRLANRFGHFCSPFAALTTPVMQDVAVPKDLPKTQRMISHNYGFEASSENPKKMTIRFTPDPLVQAVAKKTDSSLVSSSRPVT